MRITLIIITAFTINRCLATQPVDQTFSLDSIIICSYGPERKLVFTYGKGSYRTDTITEYHKTDIGWWPYSKCVYKYDQSQNILTKHLYLHSIIGTSQQWYPDDIYEYRHDNSGRLKEVEYHPFIPDSSYARHSISKYEYDTLDRVICIKERYETEGQWADASTTEMKYNDSEQSISMLYYISKGSHEHEQEKLTITYNNEGQLIRTDRSMFSKWVSSTEFVYDKRGLVAECFVFTSGRGQSPLRHVFNYDHQGNIIQDVCYYADKHYSPDDKIQGKVKWELTDIATYTYDLNIKKTQVKRPALLKNHYDILDSAFPLSQMSKVLESSISDTSHTKQEQSQTAQGCSYIKMLDINQAFLMITELSANIVISQRQDALVGSLPQKDKNVRFYYSRITH